MTIDGKVCKLLKAMYGLRDAGAAFDGKVLDVMNLMGVSLGKFSICVGYRKAMNTACLVQLVTAEGGERWDNESKAVSTPGVRTTDEEDGKELGAEDRAWRCGPAMSVKTDLSCSSR